MAAKEVVFDRRYSKNQIAHHTFSLRPCHNVGALSKPGLPSVVMLSPEVICGCVCFIYVQRSDAPASTSISHVSTVEMPEIWEQNTRIWSKIIGHVALVDITKTSTLHLRWLTATHRTPTDSWCVIFEAGIAYNWNYWLALYCFLLGIDYDKILIWLHLNYF